MRVPVLGRVALVTSLLLMACTNSTKETEAANVFLELSNLSQVMTDVDIEVYVDEELVLQERIQSAFDRPADSQTLTFETPTRTFELALAPGTHSIRILSTETQAEKMAELQVTSRPIWCAVQFNYSPGGKLGIKIPARFSLHCQDEPLSAL